MKYRHFEANYLITLIASILNQKTPSSPARATNWRELFYLAEFQDVANIACYALIAVFDNVPAVWKDRFYKNFRKCVSMANEQEKEVQAVTEALEHSGTDFVFLRDWQIRDYYPQADMKTVEDIKLFVHPEDQKTIRSLMERLGYHFEGKDEYGTTAYYKTIESRFMFYQTLFPYNKPLKTYFSKTWKQVKPMQPGSSRHIWSLEDFYVYLAASVCDNYARGEIDARDVIDLYLYFRKYKDELNRMYVDEKLKNLELAQMTTYLEEIGELWFGGYEGEEVRDHQDIEEYIWSKGAYGKEISEKILPMIQDMRNWKIRDARKRKIKRIVRWFFPSSIYMESRFPLLGRIKPLLPLLWILRLFLVAYGFVKIRVKKLVRAVVTKLHEKSQIEVEEDLSDYERREEELQRRLREVSKKQNEDYDTPEELTTADAEK